MAVAELSAIPDGTDVFIDSNIFIYALNGQSPQCSALLEKISAEEITGVTSYHVVGEVTHRLMLAEFMASGQAPAKVREYLESHPDVVQGLTRYWTGTERILAMNMLFVAVDELIIRNAHPIRQQCGLLNNDSLIAASMNHLGLTSIASNDEGFQIAGGFTVFRPTDV